MGKLEIDKKVSIIVPVYNVEKYLEVCVDSLVKQTYENLEIILVDDGSTDNCPRICDDWSTKDSRICVIHKKNGGLSDARNAALDICSGDYILFIDSDDYIHYTCIETLLNNLEKWDADIARGDFLTVTEEGKMISRKICSGSGVDVLNNIELCNRIMKHQEKVSVCNTLYKKELFDNLRFPVGIQHEDEAVIFQLSYPINRYVCVHENLYYYRSNPSSIMRKPFSIKRFDTLKALVIRLDYLQDKDFDLWLQNLRLYLHLLTYYKYIGKNYMDFTDAEIELMDKEIEKVYCQLGKHNNIKTRIIYYFNEQYGFLVWLKNRKRLVIDIK